jgi:L-cysteine/cystine lyase
VITPPGPQAGLITFNLEGYDPARVMTRLVEEDIILRFLAQPYALRISTGFYNTEADIDRLISALEAILAVDSETLPEFVPL